MKSKKSSLSRAKQLALARKSAAKKSSRSRKATRALRGKPAASVRTVKMTDVFKDLRPKINDLPETVPVRINPDEIYTGFWQTNLIRLTRMEGGGNLP